MKNIRLIIFDWDGTLADSISVIASSLIDAFEETGLGKLEYERATSIIGLPLVKALEVLHPGISPVKHAQLLGSYKKYFLQRTPGGQPLFNGVQETLRRLKEAGIYLAVATGKSRAGLERDLDGAAVREFLSSTKTIDECHPKPDPHMILTIMDELGVDPSETLMVGDTSFDLEMARNAGVFSLASTYGAHTLEELLPFQPVASFESFESLSKYILGQVIPAEEASN